MSRSLELRRAELPGAAGGNVSRGLELRRAELRGAVGVDVSRGLELRRAELRGAGGVEARNPPQHGEHATLRLDARRVAIGDKQAARLERRERAAIGILADAVEDDVESARQDAREVFVLVVDRRGAELADQRRMLAARGAPQF